MGHKHVFSTAVGKTYGMDTGYKENEVVGCVCGRRKVKFKSNH